MNNKTLETLRGTKMRLEACLDVDKKLDKFQQASIRDILEIVDRLINEATPTQNPA